MVPDTYRFTGHTPTGYMAYRDLDTGSMLVAEPGGLYQIQGISLEDPVPPPDGRWEAVPDDAETPIRRLSRPSIPAPSGDVTVEGPTATAGTTAPPPQDTPTE